MKKPEYTNISRRKFLELAVVGAAAAGVASCSPATPVATVAPAVTKAIKPVRFGFSEPEGPTATCDPAFADSWMDRGRCSAIYDQLVALDENLKAQPNLAESWTSNEKADVWTFKIRQDVSFHDGSKLTAKDIVYSFNRVLDPQTASGGAGEMGIPPESASAIDDYTVQFKLPNTMVDLPVSLNNSFSWIVKDGATSEDLKKGGIGTGPFKIAEFIPGQEPTVLVKNEKYWRPGIPKTDRLEFRGISEASARTSALLRGQIDIIEDVPLASLKELEADSNINVLFGRSGAFDGLTMFVDTPPYDDNNVRLAMKYATDRQKLLDVILQGHGVVANDNPVPPYVEYGLQGSPRVRDVEKAKTLLKDAGYPNGIELELAFSTTRPYWVDLATAFKEMFAEAGITLNLKQTAADTFWDDVWMKVPFITNGWSGRACDPMLSVAWLSTADWNDSHWYRDDFDKFIMDARQTIDYDARKALYQQAQQLLVDEGGYIIPFFEDVISAGTKEVSGYKPGYRHNFYDFTNITVG